MGNNPGINTASPLRTLKRLLKLMFSDYKLQLIMVFVMIVLSAFANVQGSLFIQTVIDKHITPMLGQSNPDFAGLLQAIMQLSLIHILRCRR